MKSTCVEDVKERYNWNFTKSCFLIVLTLLTILIFIVIFVFTKINGLNSKVREYTTMWTYGRHYHVESIGVKRWSFDCGMMVDFKQSNRASSKYKNIVERNIQYIGKIQEIIESDYYPFRCCNFKCRWYEAVDRT